MALRTNGFVGSWRLSLFPEMGTTPHIALATFGADGALVASPPAVEEFPLVPAGVVYVGAGHGEWIPTGKSQAALSFEAQASDARGALVGIGSVYSDLVLGADGRNFTGSYVFEMADQEGNAFATEAGTIEARRIEVRAPAMSAAGKSSA